MNLSAKEWLTFFSACTATFGWLLLIWTTSWQVTLAVFLILWAENIRASGRAQDRFGRRRY